MSEGYLDEHERRVEHAREQLVADVERISQVGQEMGKRVVKARTLLLVCGSGLLLGALVIRRLSRRTRFARVYETPIGPERHSLARRAVEALLIEVMRQASVYMSARLLPIATAHQEHEEVSSKPEPAEGQVGG